MNLRKLRTSTRFSARLALHAAIAALLAGHGAAHGDGETLYHFVDEHGVPHFSNQPADPRYRPLQMPSLPVSNSAHGKTFRSTSALEAQLLGPAHAALGDAFDITLVIPGSEVVTGWVEVSFDPEALELETISADSDSPEPGRVRIELDSELSTSFSASLTFHVVAQQPMDVSVELTQLNLLRKDGKPLDLQPGALATISLSTDSTAAPADDGR